MLNKQDLQELIAATRQHIDLSDALIDKDYYVTQVIHALSNIENECFCLIFAGGTCLAKAHKIVNRMSEDVDFKIHLKNKDNFSRTLLIKKLKEFRSQIKSALTIPNLTIDEAITRNEGRYQLIRLKYPYAFPANPSLRPELLLEFTLSEVRLSAENLFVQTIIEDTLEHIKLFSPPQTQCISINETAIEKWVGLTRRVIAIEREYHSDDKTLVRHIYDLSSMQKTDRLNANFFTLAAAIVSNDAKQFKNQHPEYAINPKDEILRSLDLLKTKALWKERYEEFIETMVYDNTNILDYEHAMAFLEQISLSAINSLP